MAFERETEEAGRQFIAPATDERPIRELLDTTQREPVTIEKHGRAVAVVVSAEEYKEMEALKFANSRAEIGEGLDDLEAGRTVGGEEAFKALRERLA